MCKQRQSIRLLVREAAVETDNGWGGIKEKLREGLMVIYQRPILTS